MNYSKLITAAVLALLAIASPLRSASAAPMTLKFEATVKSLFNLWAATPEREAPPIILQVGDVVSGSVTFDPSVPLTSSNDWSQPYGFELTVAGVGLSTDKIGGWVIDDRRSAFVAVDAIYTGPVTPDPVVFAGDRVASPAAPIIDDRIELATYRTLPNALMVPGSQDWHWQPALLFSGPTSVLNSDGDLPGKQAIWDAMTEKTFRFGLAKNTTLSIVTADATLTSLSLVPEPSTLLSSLMAGIALATKRGVTRPRRPHTDYRSPTN